MPDCPITRLPDSRVASAIGRTARLDMVFEKRGDRTILAHAYAEPPLRIGRSFDLGGAAYIILVCSGPGVFAGDTLRQSVHVGRGARVVLTSQAALQVHPGPSALPPSRLPALLPSCLPALLPSCPPALLEHSYVVEPDAELHCQWDPVIPFAGARLDQRFDLRIEESSRLFWGDAVMAGRVSRGEAWQFESLRHELRLRVGPALAYLERYVLAPEGGGIPRRWVCGDATYLATALAHHAGATAEAAGAPHRETARIEGVRAAVDLVAPGLLLARFLAQNGAAFGRARAAYRAEVLRSIFCRPELAGRK